MGSVMDMNYVECDVPEGMTLIAWSRGHRKHHRRRFRLRLGLA